MPRPALSLASKLALALLLSLSPGSAAGADAAGSSDTLRRWIASESAKVRETAVQAGAGGSGALTALDDVARDAEAGRTLIALRRLTLVRGSLAGNGAYQTAAADHAAGKLDAAAVEGNLEKAWIEANAVAAAPATAPAILRAFADAARNRARGVVAGGRGFFRTGDLAGGVAYVAMARDDLATAAELLTLGVAERPAPTPHGLAGELEAVETLAEDVYARPGVEVARHADFISLHSQIKESRELLARGWDLAALATLLDVRRRLVALDDTVTVPDVATLGSEAAAWRTRIAGLPHDAGIALLFLERAESELGAAATDPEAARRVAASLRSALPRYFELVSEDPT